MHKRDVLWGQILISALVISSAGQGRIGGVIAHRDKLESTNARP